VVPLRPVRVVLGGEKRFVDGRAGAELAFLDGYGFPLGLAGNPGTGPVLGGGEVGFGGEAGSRGGVGFFFAMVLLSGSTVNGCHLDRLVGEGRYLEALAG
jgi:hypothetical protein